MQVSWWASFLSHPCQTERLSIRPGLDPPKYQITKAADLPHLDISKSKQTLALTDTKPQCLAGSLEGSVGSIARPKAAWGSVPSAQSAQNATGLSGDAEKPSLQGIRGQHGGGPLCSRH